MHVSSRRPPLLALHLAAGAHTHARADSPTHAFTCGTCSPAAHSFNVRVRVSRASSCAACVDERVRCSIPCPPRQGLGDTAGTDRHTPLRCHTSRGRSPTFAVVGRDCRRSGLLPPWLPSGPLPIHSVTESRNAQTKTNGGFRRLRCCTLLLKVTAWPSARLAEWRAFTCASADATALSLGKTALLTPCARCRASTPPC